MHEGDMHSSAWPSIRSDEGGHPDFVQFCRTAGHMRKWFFTGAKKDGNRGGVRPIHSEERPEAQALFMLQGPALSGEGALFALAADHGERSEQSEDRKSTRLNSSHIQKSRMPSSA